VDGKALVDDIAAQIQTRIMDGRIEVGTRLRQEPLARELGVSRTPVREALRELQAMGLLELLPRRGAVVRAPSAREIREANAVRAELEGFAAELAAELITDDQLARLREADRLFHAAVAEAAGWPQANDLFHQVVLEASGNRRLAETVGHLHRRFPRNLTLSALAGSSRLLRDNAEEHARIRAHIEQRDTAGARRITRRHVVRAGELVARRAEELSSGPPR
jgi:DNA-binding GntR family transcriptional regulator